MRRLTTDKYISCSYCFSLMICCPMNSSDFARKIRAVFLISASSVCSTAALLWLRWLLLLFCMQTDKHLHLTCWYSRAAYLKNPPRRACTDTFLCCFSILTNLTWSRKSDSRYHPKRARFQLFLNQERTEWDEGFHHFHITVIIMRVQCLQLQ